MIIRKPAVAGQFYPRNKNELKEMVKRFFTKAEVVEEKGQLSVLIVPHAGYIYSGQTAADGFKNLTFNLPTGKAGIKHLTKVIFLGVSHQSWFNGAAIDNSDYWETPLGKVKVDKDLGGKLITNGVEFNNKPHLSEHSLEVELPFLQTVLKDFSIVPVLIGQTDNQTLEKLAEKISESFIRGEKGKRGDKEETILIISSDLSHYPDSETCRLVDKRTIEAIKSGEIEIFEKELKNLARDYPSVETFSCGSEAIKVGMMVAKKIGALKSKIFYQTNSGEVTGDTNRVVGYATIGFYK